MSPAVRSAVLASALVACADPVAAPDPAPIPNAPPPPPTALGPAVTGVVPVMVTQPGPIEVVIIGRELSRLHSVAARLAVGSGAPSGPMLRPTAPPQVIGDTMARVPFLVGVDLENGRYDLQVVFLTAEGTMTTDEEVGAVRIVRPLPQVDSIQHAFADSTFTTLTIRIWGRRLDGLESVEVIGVGSFRGADAAWGSNGVEGAIELGSLPVGGRYPVSARFRGSDVAGPAVLEDGRLFLRLDPVPAVLNPFHVELQPFGGRYVYRVTGSGMHQWLRAWLVPPGAGPTNTPPGLTVAVSTSSNDPTSREVEFDIAADTPEGPYDLLIRTAAGVETRLAAAVTIVPPTVVSLGAGPVILPVSLVTGAPACLYDWDWFGEFVETCRPYQLDAASGGLLLFSVDFAPIDCNDYGGLWISLGPPGVGYQPHAEHYWAGCVPYATTGYPVRVAPGRHELTVGLHAVPDWWRPGDAAQPMVTITFVPDGP